ncbi:UNKNOWN [Stylonychia lemnae]|uniref:Uncharacterized protein n=1 Tax=Stylonychia lemnae TaxID=5949 RepID=A0A078A9B2_STYLE|nr:UNKNOWN [Stylonychia lemnae]|eukprot:CDW78441.1 UNKNOWN [Stylonychia lemnae]
MAALADQEVMKRQNIEFQYGQTVKEKDFLNNLNQQLIKDKSSLEQERKHLQTALTEQRNQNQKLSENIIQYRKTIETQQHQLGQYQQLVNQKEVEKSIMQQQISMISQQQSVQNVQQPFIGQDYTSNSTQSTPTQDQKKPEEIIMTNNYRTLSPQKKINIKKSQIKNISNILSQSNPQSNDVDRNSQLNPNDSIEQPIDSDKMINDDLQKLKLENKSLKTKIKKEEETRKHWQDICKKKEEEVFELRKFNEDMKMQVEQEKTSSKRHQLQLSAKFERVKALEKKFGVKDLHEVQAKAPQPGRIIVNDEEIRNKMSNTVTGGVLIGDKTKKDRARGKSVRFKEPEESDLIPDGEGRPKLFGTGEY